MSRQKTVAIIGGGPGGYESALVAAAAGASVTVIESQGMGGAAVLTDCVPSKALIATSDFMSRFSVAGRMGVGFEGSGDDQHAMANLPMVNERIIDLAHAQSNDIRGQIEGAGVRVCRGTACITGPNQVSVTTEDGVE
ncbi:MAG: FAD-dependent oxidoreductase, partial [Allobranchiibius sp.]